MICSVFTSFPKTDNILSSISLSSFLKYTSYWSKQTGIRLQLLLALFVVWFCGAWLKSEYGQDESTFWLVMRLFFIIVQWTLIGMCALSLASALLIWLHFRYLNSRGRVSVQVKFGDGQKAEAGWVSVSIGLIGSILRPLLGTVQCRLVFSEQRISEKIILDSGVPKPKSWWRSGIRGDGTTLLHDRGIYAVEKVLVSFCDMLGLVSLPATLTFTQQLYTLPIPLEEQKVKAQPNATEEQVHRIDIPKRVEGEYVNYKEFETGDNIQRIVWKIYAKSGELVVRVPETKDPYASHLYFYVSYYHGLQMSGGAFEIELLNVYKDQVRNLFEAVQKNGYEVRMPPDQEIAHVAGVSEKKNDLFQITAAQWQTGLPASKFVHANKAAIVCIPTLTPVDELQIIFRTLPENIPLVAVKLSDAIPSPFQIRVKDIFFRPESRPVDALRQPWMLSRLRRDLQKNEKRIAELLKQRGNSWLTNSVAFER